MKHLIRQINQIIRKQKQKNERVYMTFEEINVNYAYR